MQKFLNRLTKILYTFIGIDKKALGTCLPVTQSIYLSLSIVFTSVIIYAAFIMAFTLSTVSNSIYTIIICSFIYSLIIIGLERIIINKSFGVWGFIMRVLLAFLIATVVSIPAEMWVFRQEIDYEISSKETERIKSNIKELQGYKDSTSNKIVNYRETINKYNAELAVLIKEEVIEKAKSSITYKVYRNDGGYSVFYKFVPTARLEELRQLLPQLRKQLSEVTSDYENERNYLLKSNTDYTLFINNRIKSEALPVTFASRYKTVEMLKEKDQYYNQIGWGVRIFFFCIEIMVVLLKTLTSNNEYERLQSFLYLKRITSLEMKSYSLSIKLHKKEVKSIIRTDIKNLIRPLINSFKRNGKNHINLKEV